MANPTKIMFKKVTNLSCKFKQTGRKCETVSRAVWPWKTFPVNKHYLTWTLGERFCPAWLSHSDRRIQPILKILKNSFSLVPLQRDSPQIQILTAPSKLQLERGRKGGKLTSLEAFHCPFPKRPLSWVSIHQEIALQEVAFSCRSTGRMLILCTRITGQAWSFKLLVQEGHTNQLCKFSHLAPHLRWGPHPYRFWYSTNVTATLGHTLHRVLVHGHHWILGSPWSQMSSPGWPAV